ncbi:MAG: hypothetical protein L3K19_00405 [Thermoplasmata archaeon]|nr:hypothetical protein [Thermoplasmata archaeon]
MPDAPPAVAAAPPPPTWTPMPAAPMAGRPIPWAMLGTLAKIIGFVLFFVGIIIVVAFASIPGGCVSNAGSCTGTNTGFATGVLNAIIAGKILVVLGLSGFAAGAGIKLHWGTKPAAGEDAAAYLASHRFNGLLFFISVVLLMWLLATVNASPAPFPLPP